MLAEDYDNGGTDPLVFVKTGSRARIGNEASFYRKLERAQYLGVPRLIGVEPVARNAAKLSLHIERMHHCITDHDGTNVYARAASPRQIQIKKRYYDPEDPPMRPLASVETFFDVAYQVALNLLYWHVVFRHAHRDVKPDNLCVDCEGFVCLIDLEYACSIDHDDAEKWSFCVGTKSYAAPEMLAHVGGDQFPYDERCDVWSYGVTLFEMFTGLDFGGSSAARVTQEKLDDRVSSLTPLRVVDGPLTPPDATRDVVALLHRCLRRRFQERATMFELVLAPEFTRRVPIERRRDLEVRFSVAHLLV